MRRSSFFDIHGLSISFKKWHDVCAIVRNSLCFHWGVVLMFLYLPASQLVKQIPKLYPDSKVHGANMGPTWVLSASDEPHDGPMNLAIWVPSRESINDSPIQSTYCFMCIRHWSAIMISSNFKIGSTDLINTFSKTIWGNEHRIYVYL